MLVVGIADRLDIVLVRLQRYKFSVFCPHLPMIFFPLMSNSSLFVSLKYHTVTVAIAFTILVAIENV